MIEMCVHFYGLLLELDLEILLDVAVGQKALLLIAIQAFVLLDDATGLQLLGLDGFSPIIPPLRYLIQLDIFHIIYSI